MPKKKTNRTCEICGIKEAHLEKSLFFANFPLDENRCREWVQVTGNEDLVYLPIEKLHTMKHICGHHFKEKDYNIKGNRLKKHSIPKLNLNSPLTDDQMAGFPLHLWKPQNPGPSTNQQELPSTTVESLNETTPKKRKHFEGSPHNKSHKGQEVKKRKLEDNIVTDMIPDTVNEQRESDREEEVKEEPLPTIEEALKAAELLSRFVHSNIENDNLAMAMSSLHNGIRDCYYNTTRRKQ